MTTVSAFADRSIHERIEVEDIAVAILRFQNGAVGVIEGSTTCFSPTGHGAEIHLCGSEGSIFMRDDTFTAWEFKQTLPVDRRVRRQFMSGASATGVGAADPTAIDFTGHCKNFENVVHALKTKGQPLVDGLEARKSIEIILAIYQSALKGGKPVALPLKKTPLRRNFR